MIPSVILNHIFKVCKALKNFGSEADFSIKVHFILLCISEKVVLSCLLKNHETLPRSVFLHAVEERPQPD